MLYRRTEPCPIYTGLESSGWCCHTNLKWLFCLTNWRKHDCVTAVHWDWRWNIFPSSDQQNSNRTPRNREGLGRVSVCPPVLVSLPAVTDDDNRSLNPECDQTASPHECFGNEKSKRQERPSIYSDITALNFRDSGWGFLDFLYNELMKLKNYFFPLLCEQTSTFLLLRFPTC